MSDTAASYPVCPSEALLTKLYCEHFKAVRSYLTRRLGCPESAGEAAQEIFVRLLLRPQLVPIENPRGFLLKAARNLTIDIMRAQGSVPVIESIDDHEQSLLDPVSDPARIAEARQRLKFLADGIGRLPRRCREVFLLHRFEGLAQRDIAQRLGIATKTVEASLARAMLHLRRCWVG